MVGGREGSSEKFRRASHRGDVTVNSRGDGVVLGGMLRWCCCCPRTASVHPTPHNHHTSKLDLVADLPSHTRNSSAKNLFKEKLQLSSARNSLENADGNIRIEENVEVRSSRSPSIEIEEYSQKSNTISSGRESTTHSLSDKKDSYRTEDIESHKSVTVTPVSRIPSRSGSLTPAKSRSVSPASAKSGNSTLDATGVTLEPIVRERDVRVALAECILPARHENWEAIVTGLTETEILAADVTARAPTSSWRAAVRGAAVHVRSLRSRVARVACRAVAALFEHRGRVLDSELEEAASALLERCADANRFLRGDAADALVRVACGSGLARAAVALTRRGATHRAGPVRAAAANALNRLARHAGASRTLDLPAEPRTVLLRATGELLTDACPEARQHARQLVMALAEDLRFRPLLKEAMPLTRYRAVEKLIDKLR